MLIHVFLGPRESWKINVALTQAPGPKRDKEPCPSPEQLISMKQRGHGEEDNENNGGCLGGIITVELEVGNIHSFFKHF